MKEMDRADVEVRKVIDHIYDVVIPNKRLMVSAKNTRDRTKAQLFFIGSKSKEFYVIVGDRVDAKSTRILIEHPVNVYLQGVFSDENAKPYAGSTVKNAAAGRKITIRNQHSVYVDSTAALNRLLDWYGDATGILHGAGELSSKDTYSALSSDEATREVAPESETMSRKISDDAQRDLESDTLALRTDEREAVVKVRFGQGDFRNSLLKDGEYCWMSGVEGNRLLIASHIKPWSHCESDRESRGNPNNGLLLSSLWDAAFDSGLITFDAQWNVVISTELSISARQALNVETNNCLPARFRNDRRAQFLTYHRERVFEYWKQSE